MNFSPTAASNIVRSGVVQATVLSAAADSLVVRVPVGANYQELTVTVTTTGLTGYCNTRAPFIETFGPGGTAFSAGSFAAGTTASLYGDAIGVMDLNGDGKPDILSGTIGINGVQEGRRAFGILNNSSSSGTIAFSTQHVFATNAPYYCVPGDMNGDGRPDVVAWDTTTSDEIAVYLNTGSGSTISFDGGTRYAYGGAIAGQPGKLIVRDLDGDGKPDVLTMHTVATGDTSYFTFLQNTGSGGTVSLVQQPDLIAQLFNTGQRKVYDFIVQDFDGDGKPDIISFQQNGFYFYHNTSVPGTISFSAGAQTGYEPPGTTFSGLTAADMDGDGFPELIYVDPTNNLLHVDWNDGQSGTPGFYSSHTYATGNSPQRVAIGDLDGDGKPDIAVSNFNDGSVSVYRNTCPGGINALSFDAQSVYSTGGAGTAYELAIVDMDGDHRPDLVAANGATPQTLTILRNLVPLGGMPTITAFAPMTASAGTSVGITGTNFTGLLGVSFGDVPAVSFTVNSPDSITAVVGNAASGSLVVTAPGGSDTVAGFVYANEPAPIVTSFSPTSATPYNPITIHGSHFTNTVSATVGGFALAFLNVVNDSTITGYPGHNGGSGYVAVFTPAGSDSLPGFVYSPLTPQVYSFTPTIGHPGDSISVYGHFLTGLTSVTLGGVPVASYLIESDTTMIAVVGNGASGAMTVNHYGQSASKSGFIFVEPSPTIGAFTPATALQGTTVTISGHYFTGATAVSFGGTNAASFSVSNDSTILAVVATGSSGMVAVTTTQGNSSLAGFTYGVPTPTVPTITAFTPTSGRRGDSVTITGHYFTGTTAVAFGVTNAASYLVMSDSVLLTVVGTGSTGLVTVTTPQGYGPSTGTFTFLPDTTPPPPPPTPTVGAFSPTSALQGATVTISGHNFTGATAVGFGGTPAASFTVSNDSTIVAVVGTGSTGSVSVTTPDGNSALAGFTYGVPPPAPTITAFSPGSGKRGDSVTITGRYFTGTTAVTFGGTNAASYIVMSDSVVLTVVGTGSTGLVSVTTPEGTGTLAQFTFLAADTSSPTPPDTTAATPPFAVKGFWFDEQGEQVILGWIATHDQGIDRYIIQEGSSSTQLTSIDSVASQHQDSATYSYLDPSIRTGVVWYGLLAVDSSGKQVYKGTLSVVLLAQTSAFPNPAVGLMQVTVPGTSTNSRIELVDMSGRVLLMVPVSAGATQVRISVTGINTGTYQLNWSDGTHQKTQTVVIMH